MRMRLRTRSSSAARPQVSLWMLPPTDGGGGDASSVASTAAAAAATATARDFFVNNIGGGGGLGPVETFILVWLGLILLTKSFVLPPVARIYEELCKELAPEIWEKYSGQLLETGETLAERPDLFTKLVLELKPYMDANIARLKEQELLEEQEAENAIQSMIQFMDEQDKYFEMLENLEPAPSPIADEEEEEDDNNDDDN